MGLYEELDISMGLCEEQCGCVIFDEIGMCATKDRGLGIECICTTVFMVVIKPLYPV